MTAPLNYSENAQGIEKTPRKKGKRSRVSPRSLTPLTRRLVVEEFAACGDIDDVAEAFRLPVRTVDSILHWHQLRKPPASERCVSIAAYRRTA